MDGATWESIQRKETHLSDSNSTTKNAIQKTSTNSLAGILNGAVWVASLIGLALGSVILLDMFVNYGKGTLDFLILVTDIIHPTDRLKP